MSDIPIYKRVNRQWKVLPHTGDDSIGVKDPKLKQGYLGDLTKKTLIELEEIFKRNQSVLNNKFLLSKLKDKGKSLQARQLEIGKVLEDARETERKHKKVPDQNDIHGFEWTGSLTNNTGDHSKARQKQDPEEDEDGDNLDPLVLMAHHSSCVDHRQSEATRLADDDPASGIARELEQMEINDARIEGIPRKTTAQFGEIRNEMFQRKFEQNGPARVSFKPYRPVSNPKPVPGLIVKHRTVVRKPVITISQEESQRLEKDYLDKQKERELRLTIEGLARPNKVLNMCQLPSNPVGNYRDANRAKHILDSDEEEEEDEDEDQLGKFDDNEEDALY